MTAIENENETDQAVNRIDHEDPLRATHFVVALLPLIHTYPVGPPVEGREVQILGEEKDRHRGRDYDHQLVVQVLAAGLLLGDYLLAVVVHLLEGFHHREEMMKDDRTGTMTEQDIDLL